MLADDDALTALAVPALAAVKRRARLLACGWRAMMSWPKLTLVARSVQLRGGAAETVYDIVASGIVQDPPTSPDRGLPRRTPVVESVSSTLSMLSYIRRGISKLLTKSTTEGR